MQLTAQQEKAVSLLGQGIQAERVAEALGVTASAISQLVSDPEVAERIAELRYNALEAHNVRDNKYDTLEDRLIDQLSDLLPLMTKPMEILRSIQVINAAKRRGASTPQSITGQQTHFTLVLPTVIMQKFSTNVNNQVVAIENKELLTIQSNSLLETINDTGKTTKEVARTSG